MVMALKTTGRGCAFFIWSFALILSLDAFGGNGRGECKRRYAALSVSGPSRDGFAPLLSKEEERELFSQIEIGRAAEKRLSEDLKDHPDHPELPKLTSLVAEGQKAREKVILANRRLVIRIARDFRERGLPLEDLVSAGNIGLIISVDNFNADFGAKLSTYATWWIRQSIQRALIDTAHTIRVPHHNIELLNAYYEKQREMMASNRDESPPDFASVTAKLNLLKNEREALRLALKARSTQYLQDFTFDDQSEPQDHMIASYDPNDQDPIRKLIAQEEASQIARVIDGLKKIDKRLPHILKLRFLGAGKKKSLKAIGEELDLTAEGVRQLEARGLRHLRQAIEQEQ